MKKLFFFLGLMAALQPVFAGNSDELTFACMRGDLAGVQKAIENGADLNAASSKGWNPISAAFFWPEITQLLIDKGANPAANVFDEVLRSRVFLTSHGLSCFKFKEFKTRKTLTNLDLHFVHFLLTIYKWQEG